MFSKNCWSLLAVSCILFVGSPVRGEEASNIERDANAKLGQRVNPDLMGAMLMARESNDQSPCNSQCHISTACPPTTTPAVASSQSLSSAICEIATALCAACPPSVTTHQTTITISSCPLATVTTTVTECFGPPPSTSTSSSLPFSTPAISTPSSSIRFSNSSSIRPPSSAAHSSSSGLPSTTSIPTTRSSTPMGPGFSSTIPPRTGSSTLSTPLTTTESTRPTTPRGSQGTQTITRRSPPGIVRREMMGNITAIVTNTTRTFANATTSRTLNLTGILTETTTTTTTTIGVFPRFQRVRYRD
ncbi:uncharacterized protein N7458_010316 [Penicillium daleae]|uniref:Uncharacterized protein n=1 Tax=Penicillium daleae TaxID=63821 RepID=A0AAD6FYX5_9EURO|nr:uncharacterized protein N7458_010316 [Penicillium daleae]KAJ5439318.1 hypothetical protein N7458_010316 [Penicillium daleae]